MPSDSISSRSFVGMLAALVLVAVFGISRAAAPLAISEVGLAGDLVAEAKAKVAELEPLVESEEAFTADGAASKRVQGASVLACLAQAIAEHGEKSDLASAAPGLRDASLKLAHAGSFADAQAALASVQKAMTGEVIAGAEVSYPWNKLINMHASMEEMNARTAAIRRALKRSRDPVADSRNALVVAVLSVATHADTHEVHNEADKPKWYEFATELQQAMSQTATSLRGKDSAAAAKHFAAGMETCSKCHAEFKHEEEGEGE